MKIIKFGQNCYLVEWEYKDFLRIGHSFQNETIIKLEKINELKKDYIKVTTINYNNHL